MSLGIYDICPCPFCGENQLFLSVEEGENSISHKLVCVSSVGSRGSECGLIFEIVDETVKVSE